MSGTSSTSESANSIAAAPRSRDRVFFGRPDVRRMAFPLQVLSSVSARNRRWRGVGGVRAAAGLADHDHLPLAAVALAAAAGLSVVLGDRSGLLRVEAPQRPL